MIMLLPGRVRLSMSNSQHSWASGLTRVKLFESDIVSDASDTCDKSKGQNKR